MEKKKVTKDDVHQVTSIEDKNIFVDKTIQGQKLKVGWLLIVNE